MTYSSKTRTNGRVREITTIVRKDDAMSFEEWLDLLIDKEIAKNRDEFVNRMQGLFEEYDLKKTGSTPSMRKAAAENAMKQDNLDRQANRDAQVRQQEADNAYRKMESQQNYKLKSQQQMNNVVKDLQENNFDYEIINGTNNNR